MNEKVYIQGETIAIRIPDAGYDSVSLRIADKAAAQLVLTDGMWTADVSSDNLSGNLRYAALAHVGASVRCVAEGSVFVRVMRSRYRDVIEAINTAIEKVAANGKYSVTVGELSLQDKTFDEMVKFAAYYKGLAEAEEAGTATTGCVGTIFMEF